MKLSELIEDLSELLDKKGDMDVLIKIDGEFYSKIQYGTNIYGFVIDAD